MREWMEDRCAVMSTGTRRDGSYPFKYRGREKCECKAPPDDWWHAGQLPCGCPRWWPTLAEAKAIIDAELTAAGYVLLDTADAVSVWEIMDV